MRTSGVTVAVLDLDWRNWVLAGYLGFGIRSGLDFQCWPVALGTDDFWDDTAIGMAMAMAIAATTRDTVTLVILLSLLLLDAWCLAYGASCMLLADPC